MQKPLMALMIASLVLAGCGWRDSRVNPRNWFGKSREVEQTADVGPVNPLIPVERPGAFSRPDPVDMSVPISSVISLRIDPTSTGAIVLASGVAERQGAYQARLVPDNDKLEPTDGVLTFTFRVTYPSRGTRQGSEFSRTINEAYSLSDKQLEGIRTIRVLAAGNALETRRR